MSGLFVDDLAKAQNELREARQQADTWERRFNDTVTEKRQAEHRAAVAEARAETLEGELESARRQISDALKRAESAQVSEARANEQQERADKLDAEMATLRKKLSDATATGRAAKSRVAELEQTLRDREKEFGEARRVLEAAAQRAAPPADEVLAAVKL